MRYNQAGRVRRIGDSDDYRVVVEVILTPRERDLWGSGQSILCLVPAEREPTRAVGGGAAAPAARGGGALVRRFMFAAFAALILAVLPVAPVVAGTHTGGHGTGPGIACTYHYAWGVTFGGSPQDVHADWETVCGDTLQVLAYCDNFQVGIYTRTSGAVTKVELNTQATCIAGDSITAAYVRIDGGNWHRLWVRT
jgi:hypothetical protein